jgi:hypothetical protein
LQVSIWCLKLKVRINLHFYESFSINPHAADGRIFECTTGRHTTATDAAATATRWIGATDDWLTCCSTTTSASAIHRDNSCADDKLGAASAKWFCASDEWQSSVADDKSFL